MNNQQIILDSSGASSFVVELDIALSTTLSNKAKGLYLVLCGLAERQNDLFKKDLINHSKEGIRSIESALRELREQGIINRELIRNNAGKIVSSRLIFMKHGYKVVTETPKTTVSVCLPTQPPSKNDDPQYNRYLVRGHQLIEQAQDKSLNK